MNGVDRSARPRAFGTVLSPNRPPRPSKRSPKLKSARAARGRGGARRARGAGEKPDGKENGREKGWKEEERGNAADGREDAAPSALARRSRGGRVDAASATTWSAVDAASATTSSAVDAASATISFTVDAVSTATSSAVDAASVTASSAVDAASDTISSAADAASAASSTAVDASSATALSAVDAVSATSSSAVDAASGEAREGDAPGTGGAAPSAAASQDEASFQREQAEPDVVPLAGEKPGAAVQPRVSDDRLLRCQRELQDVVSQLEQAEPDVAPLGGEKPLQPRVTSDRLLQCQRELRDVKAQLEWATAEWQEAEESEETLHCRIEQQAEEIRRLERRHARTAAERDALAAALEEAAQAKARLEDSEAGDPRLPPRGDRLVARVHDLAVLVQKLSRLKDEHEARLKDQHASLRAKLAVAEDAIVSEEKAALPAPVKEVGALSEQDEDAASRSREGRRARASRPAIAEDATVPVAVPASSEREGAGRARVRLFRRRAVCAVGRGLLFSALMWLPALLRGAGPDSSGGLSHLRASILVSPIDRLYWRRQGPAPRRWPRRAWGTLPPARTTSAGGGAAPRELAGGTALEPDAGDGGRHDVPEMICSD